MAARPDPAALPAHASVPAMICPSGTEMQILDLGTLQVAESWILSGANASSLSTRNPENRRRDLMLLTAFIGHPSAGPIFFKTGALRILMWSKWGARLTDILPLTEYSESQKLPAAIKETGNNIKDVKAEFKHACWAVATGIDLGVYMGHYMLLDKLSWRTLNESYLDLFQGITVHHTPRHAPGLALEWDHNAWYRSLTLIRRLQQRQHTRNWFSGTTNDVAI
ncbi:hypothetical protein BDV10DRAFT_199427 [Aspergillus recurvatus]